MLMVKKFETQAEQLEFMRKAHGVHVITKFEQLNENHEEEYMVVYLEVQ